MEDAKPVLGSAELPTGVKLDAGEVAKHVVFRELAGAEEDILSSTKMPVSQRITQILANCTLELGTIKSAPEIRKLIERLVINDRWFLLLELRCLSLGSAYKQNTKCPECSAEDKTTLDLKELSISNPPDAANLFHEMNLPSGKSIRWKVADGTTDLKMEKLAKDDNKATVGIFARVTEFNGKPVTYEDIKALSMKERTAIRKSIDEHEGDFDDEYNATCPKCGHQYVGTVTLEPQSFFFP